jgi:hypothetical protein
VTRKGHVVGKELVLTTEITGREPTEIKMKWNDKTLGLYAQERLFQERQPEPNSRFDFIKFEPSLDTWLTVHVEVKEHEETPLLAGKKSRLRRIETRLDKFMGVEFPPEVVWVNDAGEVLKRQSQLPGLGNLVMYRTTREVALVGNGQPAPDIGLGQLVRIGRVIVRPGDTREVVFRIRLKGEKDPATAFATDSRQEIRNLRGEQFDLIVRGQGAPPLNRKPVSEAPAEYLKNNHYLRSEDARVKDLALRAIGMERDPWERAVRISNWVRINIRNKNFTEAFATADEVARRLEGDCTEHAVLAAAMCRAVGVPARTALGLVHVPGERAMGYHMWLEVWIDGEWYGLDPTLGLGRVSATHVKIADQHWNDAQGLLPFLPWARVLGKLQMEVLSVAYEGT